MNQERPFHYDIHQLRNRKGIFEGTIPITDSGTRIGETRIQLFAYAKHHPENILQLWDAPQQKPYRFSTARFFRYEDHLDMNGLNWETFVQEELPDLPGLEAERAEMRDTLRRFLGLDATKEEKQEHYLSSIKTSVTLRHPHFIEQLTYTKSSRQPTVLSLALNPPVGWRIDTISPLGISNADETSGAEIFAHIRAHYHPQTQELLSFEVRDVDFETGIPAYSIDPLGSIQALANYFTAINAAKSVDYDSVELHTISPERLQQATAFVHKFVQKLPGKTDAEKDAIAQLLIAREVDKAFAIQFTGNPTLDTQRLGTLAESILTDLSKQDHEEEKYWATVQIAPHNTFEWLPHGVRIAEGEVTKLPNTSEGEILSEKNNSAILGECIYKITSTNTHILIHCFARNRRNNPLIYTAQIPHELPPSVGQIAWDPVAINIPDIQTTAQILSAQ